MTTMTKSPIRLLTAFPLRSLTALLGVALLLLSVTTLIAQERTGNIAGVVKDQSGAYCPV